MTTTTNDEYIEWKPDDLKHFGADEVVLREHAVFFGRRKRRPKSGLALSGGGIRSASFALGVMQALSYKGWLEKIDYLSTVSGGGFIGSSLSYLLHREWKYERKENSQGREPTSEAQKNGCTTLRFGLDWEHFPLGSYPMIRPDPADRADLSKGGEEKDKKEPYHRARGEILRYLRQNAKYLEPGNYVGPLSLIGVLLRNMLLSIAFFLGLVVMVLVLLTKLGLLLPPPGMAKVTALPSWRDCLAVPVVFVFAVPVSCKLLDWLRNLVFKPLYKGVVEWGYLLWTGLIAFLVYIMWRDEIPNVQEMIVSLFGCTGQWSPSLVVDATTKAYELFSGNSLFVIPVLLGGLFLVLAPVYSVWIWMMTVLSLSEEENPYSCRRIWERCYSCFLGLIPALVFLGSVPPVYEYFVKANEYIPWIIVAISVGMISFAFLRTGSTSEGVISPGLIGGLGGLILLFGLLLGGYSMLTLLFDTTEKIDERWWWAFIVLVAILGWCVNLNYLSVHRYYRDRLMETFMPNVEVLLRRLYEKRITGGNETVLTELWGGKDDYWRSNYDPPLLAGLYHIINCNVVLVNSKIPKFRGRRGDNFILSPLYCGSNATGWVSTDTPWYKDLTLPTAMAISGAAVNPNAGCGDGDPSQSRILAMVMGILNIRLGYWVPNPKWADKYERGLIGNWFSRFLACCSRIGKDREMTPNFIYPGLGEVIMRKNLDEDSGWLQLSDGGHFENLGLYELVRRRLELIIVCDGAADPKYQFTDLANAIEKVRADFGAIITFEGRGIESLIPVSTPGLAGREFEGGLGIKYAERGYIVGKIRYADTSDQESAAGSEPNMEGTLIYLATTFFRGLSEDIFAYQRTHPEFPEESTADQSFDEKQFEAYRELGYQTAYAMLKDSDIRRDPYVRKAMDRPYPW